MLLYARYLLYGFLIIFSVQSVAQPKKEVMEIKKIWDRGAHNAFTDITYFKNKLYVAFREGSGHIPNKDNSGMGKIRIMSSADGDVWESAAVLEIQGVDLRDPKLSVTPKRRLMITMGASTYDQQQLKGITSMVSISDPIGKKFSTPEPIVLDPEIKTTGYDWLWGITWHDKTGYGVMYQTVLEDNRKTTRVLLLRTDKGKEYELITPLELDGNPSEARVVFMSGEMVLAVRRDGADKMGMLGYSKAPYKTWAWQKLNFPLAGPNIEVVPIDKILIGTRAFDKEGKPYLALMMGKKEGTFREAMRLPSGGDCGYPGFFSIAGYIWMSYYSSHEGKASVYYARIPYADLLKK